jgi:hypothetical protein
MGLLFLCVVTISTTAAQSVRQLVTITIINREPHIEAMPTDTVLMRQLPIVDSQQVSDALSSHAIRRDAVERKIVGQVRPASQQRSTLFPNPAQIPTTALDLFRWTYESVPIPSRPDTATIRHSTFRPDLTQHITYTIIAL